MTSRKPAPVKAKAGQSFKHLDSGQEDDPFGYSEPLREQSENDIGVSSDILTMLQLVTPEQWNNIPIPLVKSLQALVESTKYVDRKVVELTNLVNSKNKNNSNSFLRMEKNQNESEERIYRHIGQLDREFKEQVQRTYDHVQAKADVVEEKLDRFQLKSDRDQQLIDTRLSRIDDSDVLKHWVENKVFALSSDLTLEFRRSIQKTDTQLALEIEKIYKDNLLIEGLVGDKEKFKNLKMYLKDFNSFITKALKVQEQGMFDKIQQDLSQLNETIKGTMKVMQDNLSTQSKEGDANSVDQFKQFIKEIQEQIRVQGLQSQVAETKIELAREEVIQTKSIMDEKLSSEVDEVDMSRISQTVNKLDGIRENLMMDISKIDVRMTKKLDQFQKDRDQMIIENEKRIENIASDIGALKRKLQNQQNQNQSVDSDSQPLERINSGNGYDLKSQRSNASGGRRLSGRVGGFSGMHPDTRAEIEKLIAQKLLDFELELGGLRDKYKPKQKRSSMIKSNHKISTNEEQDQTSQNSRSGSRSGPRRESITVEIKHRAHQSFLQAKEFHDAVQMRSRSNSRHMLMSGGDDVFGSMNGITVESSRGGRPATKSFGKIIQVANTNESTTRRQINLNPTFFSTNYLQTSQQQSRERVKQITQNGILGKYEGDSRNTYKAKSIINTATQRINAATMLDREIQRGKTASMSRSVAIKNKPKNGRFGNTIMKNELISRKEMSMLPAPITVKFETFNNTFDF